MSKKFVSDTTITGAVPAEHAYKMVWHSLGRKEYSSAFLEHLKEVEAKVLKQAKDKALYIEQEAYEKGFAQGEKDGLELGEKRVDTIVQQMKKVLQEIESQRESLYRVYEGEMDVLRRLDAKGFQDCRDEVNDMPVLRPQLAARLNPPWP